MKEWKIITSIVLVVALTVLITGIAYASYYNSLRTTTSTPATYNSYAPGTYGSYPSTGNSQYPNQYPTYPNTPTYPNQPTYPQQPIYPPSYYPPGYGYPYGSYGEHEIGPWGMMG